MSCIYGVHQFGNEDQGWLAHFLLRALRGEPITFYGDGRQVRDALFVEDLVDAFERAMANIDRLSGRAFNIGGGPERTTSLIELTDMIGEIIGARPEIRYEDWRRADQKYFVSDVRSFSAETGWAPRTPLRQGVQRLHDWLITERVPETIPQPRAVARARPRRTRPAPRRPRPAGSSSK